jgi:hypothetical protein
MDSRCRIPLRHAEDFIRIPTELKGGYKRLEAFLPVGKYIFDRKSESDATFVKVLACHVYTLTGLIRAWILLQKFHGLL